jgi:hypothetical protein
LLVESSGTGVGESSLMKEQSESMTWSHNMTKIENTGAKKKCAKKRTRRNSNLESLRRVENFNVGGILHKQMA